MIIKEATVWLGGGGDTSKGFETRVSGIDYGLP